MAIKKPNIGELRNVGHFENDTDPMFYTAGYVDGYTNVVASVYCKLWQTNSKRLSDFGSVQIVSSWNMLCRFQSAIESRLLEDTKFVQGSRRFTVKGFQIIDERDFYYHFNLELITA